MECNVGLVEQKARAVAGLALIGIGAYYKSKPLAFLGLVPVATATMMCWRPVSAAIGYNGCQMHTSSSQTEKDA